MGDPVRAEVLQRAAEILGGQAALRRYLKVSAAALALWMSGAVSAPTEVFLKAVDVIYERDLSDLRKH
jgi:hypothetical protein